MGFGDVSGEVFGRFLVGFGEVSGEVLGGFCQGFWEVWVEGFETLNAHKLLLIVLIENLIKLL